MAQTNSPHSPGNETSSDLLTESTGLTDFAAVPVAPRHDGWTPERQMVFIETLAACGCVADAARAVGMSETSAYRLRNRSDALAFRLRQWLRRTSPSASGFGGKTSWAALWS